MDDKCTFALWRKKVEEVFLIEDWEAGLQYFFQHRLLVCWLQFCKL